ncbi:hypothetical protein B0H10DRAFT_1966729 [Mycena sp. CBHHK59/15]|nr:hypothetical protein B0H10DRAFT_1966729 [Mycena sp. CBHHK59/15]
MPRTSGQGILKPDVQGGLFCPPSSSMPDRAAPADWSVRVPDVWSIVAPSTQRRTDPAVWTGISLLGHDWVFSSTLTNGTFEQFLARAAVLPALPRNRRMGSGVEIDPMNVMVSPSAAMGTQECVVLFGLGCPPSRQRGRPSFFDAETGTARYRTCRLLDHLSLETGRDGKKTAVNR